MFLYSNVTQLSISLLFLDIVGYLGRDTSMNSVNFASSRVPFFSRFQDVTSKEVVLRLITSFMHWLVTVYLLQAIYDGVAIIVIAFDLGRIERWPPLFGSWTDCWSIRQFWGSVRRCQTTRFGL